MPERNSENYMPLKICIGLFLTLCEIAFAQSEEIDDFFFQLKQLQFEKAREEISGYPDQPEKILLINFIRTPIGRGPKNCSENRGNTTFCF